MQQRRRDGDSARLLSAQRDGTSFPRLRRGSGRAADRAARRLIEPLEQWPSDGHRGTGGTGLADRRPNRRQKAGWSRQTSARPTVVRGQLQPLHPRWRAADATLLKGAPESPVHELLPALGATPTPRTRPQPPGFAPPAWNTKPAGPPFSRLLCICWRFVNTATRIRTRLSKRPPAHISHDKPVHIHVHMLRPNARVPSVQAGSQVLTRGIIIRVSGVRVPPPASAQLQESCCFTGISARGPFREASDRCEPPETAGEDLGLSQVRQL